MTLTIPKTSKSIDESFSLTQVSTEENQAINFEKRDRKSRAEHLLLVIGTRYWKVHEAQSRFYLKKGYYLP
jgi:hypothetical protein